MGWRKRRTSGAPKVESEPNHPPVKDKDGNKYVPDGHGGWRPEDAPDDPSLTWRALSQEVPDGELHVDHDAKDDDN